MSGEGQSTAAVPVIELERVACPLCGATGSSVVIRGGDNLCGLPGEFAVERCGRCRHMFMNPRPIAECLGLCYPPHYGPHRRSEQRAPVQPAADQDAADQDAATRNTARPVPWYLRYLPLRYVPGLRAFYYWLMDDRSQPLLSRASLPDTATPRALEIGCATGGYLRRLVAAGWRVQGIEPGPEPAAAARAAGFDVDTGVLETTRLDDRSFDAAAAWMVIEHVPDPRATLTRLSRVLKPGGQLLISIPNAGCWEPAIFGRHWYVWELPRHLHHFTPVSIRRLLTECGFESIEVIHQRTLLNVVGSLGIAMLSRWPSSRVGRKLKSYPDNPTLAIQLLLAPLAHVLAFLRQGGRLTVLARSAAGSE